MSGTSQAPEGPLGVMVWFSVKPQYREDAIRISIDYAEESVSAVPGCRRHDVVQDEHDTSKFSYYKIFDDEQAFEDHTKTESFRAAHNDEVKTWLVDGRLARTTPTFPTGDVHWDSEEKPRRSDAHSNGLHIYHAALTFQPDRVDDAKRALAMVAHASLEQESGCLRYDIHQNRGDPTEFWVYEVYQGQDAFEYHQGTRHVKKRHELMSDWYAAGFSPTDRRDVVAGPNVWPPDNWTWRQSMK